jgi:hypothetical protein
MTEDLTIFATLTPHFYNRVPEVIVSINGQPVPAPVLTKRNKAYQVGVPITASFESETVFSIQMLNKIATDNLTAPDGEVIIDHGVLISNLTIAWGPTAKDKLFYDYMIDPKGSEDNTNRVDPVWENQKKIREQLIVNSAYSKYTLNELQVKQSCKFINQAGISKEMSPTAPPSWFGQYRVFKISENGEFTFKFTAPFAYWALKNLYKHTT